MQNIDFKVDDQIVNTLISYSESKKYDIYQLTNELLEITIKRLSIDTFGVIDKIEEKRRTSKQKEKEIMKQLENNGWIKKKRTSMKYGEAIEFFIGKKVVYNCAIDTDSSYMIVSEEEKSIITEITGNSHYESNQIFTWIAPYTRETTIMSYMKEEEWIQLLVC